jgi:hypothetical protein
MGRPATGCSQNRSAVQLFQAAFRAVTNPPIGVSARDHYGDRDDDRFGEFARSNRERAVDRAEIADSN